MAAGRMAKDSDIIHGDDKDGWERLRAEKDEVREEGTTWNVAHSARLAALKQAGHDEAKSKKQQRSCTTENEDIIAHAMCGKSKPPAPVPQMYVVARTRSNARFG
ncbi:hypothetical protein MMC21_000294 [Puttea exsequens]|nr:hypothetical protein [Puttea exsequens]